MYHLIAPSILTANFLKLHQEIDLINNSEADWIHLDVMDGVFVPNLTFGFHIIRQIKSVAEKPLDTHLMIVDPDRYLDEFKAAGADILTVHYEACTHLHRTIQHIKSLGMNAGVAINPHTPIHLLETILPELDLVLNMTVNPGFGAQTFIDFSYKKIKELKKLLRKKLDDYSNNAKTNEIIEITPSITIRIYPKKEERNSSIHLVASLDENSGGAVLQIYISNINHCIQEKTNKIKEFRKNYSEWWLVLVDKLIYGLSRSSEIEIIKQQIILPEVWQKLLIINPELKEPVLTSTN